MHGKGYTPYRILSSWGRKGYFTKSVGAMPRMSGTFFRRPMLFEAGHDAVIEADFPRQLAKGTLLHLGGGPGGSAELSTGCVGIGLDVIHTLTGTFNKGLQGFWVGVRK